MGLPAGKLPAALLGQLLASLPAGDPAVVVGPGIGEDAAVLDTGGTDLLVVKTDPITLAAHSAGDYLLAVNGNDLATMGAEPRWLLVTALLPVGTDAAATVQLFEDLKRACARTGVSLVGGHTELTVGIDRPILAGCLLGTVRRDRLVRTAGARVGDTVLLAGGLAIEGTAILAREHAGVLAARGVDPATIAAAAGWLEDPGISVLPAARILNAEGRVHAMHDPTEGGLATALHELAEAAGAGLRIERDAIPVLAECRAICHALNLDPLGLLASGALLATLDPAGLAEALDRLAAAGIAGSRIGEVVGAEQGRAFVDGALLPVFGRDELARFLEGGAAGK